MSEKNNQPVHLIKDEELGRWGPRRKWPRQIQTWCGRVWVIKRRRGDVTKSVGDATCGRCLQLLRMSGSADEEVVPP